MSVKKIFFVKISSAKISLKVVYLTLAKYLPSNDCMVADRHITAIAAKDGRPKLFHRIAATKTNITGPIQM